MFEIKQQKALEASQSEEGQEEELPEHDKVVESEPDWSPTRSASEENDWPPRAKKVPVLPPRESKRKKPKRSPLPRRRQETAAASACAEEVEEKFEEESEEEGVLAVRAEAAAKATAEVREKSLAERKAR